MQGQQRVRAALDIEGGIEIGIEIHARVDLAIQGGFMDGRRCIAAGRRQDWRDGIAGGELADRRLLLGSAGQIDRAALSGQSLGAVMSAGSTKARPNTIKIVMAPKNLRAYFMRHSSYSRH